MGIFKRPITSYNNSEILSAVRRVIQDTDLPEEMRNSRKKLMSRSEFESYLQSKPDRVTELKRLTSFTKGVMTKCSISDLGAGICGIVVRTPISVSVKLPYQKLRPGQTEGGEVRVKSVGFRSVLRGGKTASPTTNSNDEELY